MPGAQGGPHAAQGLGVVPQIRAHGSGQCQVLGGSAVVAGPRQREPQRELGIVIARARFDDPPEAAAAAS